MWQAWLQRCTTSPALGRQVPCNARVVSGQAAGGQHVHNTTFPDAHGNFAVLSSAQPHSSHHTSHLKIVLICFIHNMACLACVCSLLTISKPVQAGTLTSYDVAGQSSLGPGSPYMLWSPGIGWIHDCGHCLERPQYECALCWSCVSRLARPLPISHTHGSILGCQCS